MGQPDLSSYVKSTDLGTYVKNTELKNVAPKNHDHDDRYPSKTELQNYPDKTFLSSNYAKIDHKHDDLYQTKGDYLTSADFELKYGKFDEQLTGYQTQGNYVFVDDLNTQLQGYQTRGNYVSTDDLKAQLQGYQPVGNYAPAANYALKSELDNYALKSELTGYQKAGDYALKSELTNYVSTSNGYFQTSNSGAVIGANIDNSWVLHAPNDNRNTLFIAPGNKGTGWDWTNQTTIDKAGNLTALLRAKDMKAAHPDNYDGAIYSSDGHLQVAVDNIVRFRNTRTKDTGIQFDTNQGTGDMSNPNGIMKITRQGIMFGGPNDITREGNSAQISAGRHVANSLNIVGMSSDKNAATRKIDIWAEGGMTVRGNLNWSGILQGNVRLERGVVYLKNVSPLILDKVSIKGRTQFIDRHLFVPPHLPNHWAFNLWVKITPGAGNFNVGFIRKNTTPTASFPDDNGNLQAGRSPHMNITKTGNAVSLTNVRLSNEAEWWGGMPDVPNVPINKWFMLTWNQIGRKTEIYFDGVRVSQTVHKGTPYDINPSTGLGMNGGQEDIQVGQFVYFRQPLSQGEITALHNHNKDAPDLCCNDSVTDAKFIMIQIPGNNRILNFEGIQILDAANKVVSMAGAKVSQSSTHSNLGPQQALNGLLSHTTTQNDPWWKIEFPEPVKVKLVRIVNRKDCCHERIYGLKAMVSMDDKDYKPFYNFVVEL